MAFKKKKYDRFQENIKNVVPLKIEIHLLIIMQHYILGSKQELIRIP